MFCKVGLLDYKKNRVTAYFGSVIQCLSIMPVFYYVMKYFVNEKCKAAQTSYKNKYDSYKAGQATYEEMKKALKHFDSKKTLCISISINEHKTLSILGVANVLLVSGGLAFLLTVAYKASKINLATTVGLSIAFPALWICSATFGVFALQESWRDADRECEDRFRDLTYCNPIFALTVLPVTMLIDTSVNAVNDYCKRDCTSS